MSTLTDTVDGAAPLVGVTESQVALPDAAQRSVPPPAFVTEIVWEAGLASPAWPVNARLPGVTNKTGVETEEAEDPPEQPARARRAIQVPRIRMVGSPPPDRSFLRPDI
jgi:hypothetical protein